ncbi:hypothetical protein JCM3774_002214 [Rhodotorula dairenensis]
MARTKVSPATIKKAAAALGPIPAWAPWRDFRTRENERLLKENPKLNARQRTKKISKLYAAAKAEKEGDEEA